MNLSPASPKPVTRLEVGTFPGNFYLGETREWCCLEPFSILLLRGTGPHGGTQAIPDGNPKDHEKRINVILYPWREFVNRTLPLLLPCYDSTRLSDYSFFYDGEACFGTKDYQQAWCSRELFRHFVKSNKEFGSHLDGRKLQQAGAMQGQRGTFGFHEQGESTRLKIYFYVTAI